MNFVLDAKKSKRTTRCILTASLEIGCSEVLSMMFEKITHSKCPNCKKHGLPFYKTSYKYNPLITCKFCGKKFAVNRVLSMTFLIAMLVLLGFVFQKLQEWFGVPNWICCVLGVGGWLLFQYFAPLKEHEEKG